MTGLILTRPNACGNTGSGSSNTFETLILDTGTLTASGADTLVIEGGNAIVTTGGGSPKTVTIAVDPSQINITDLGDVDTTGVTDGYVLIYRAGSPSGWVAEPSTSTDEFVKASATDTTTGHLGNKIVAGTGITFTTLNPSGNEQIEISASGGSGNAYGTITDGTNTETASGNSTLVFASDPNTGVNVTVGQTGSPAEDTVTIGFDGGLAMSLISGQPMLTFIDDTRGVSGKRLSVSDQVLVFAENQLAANDWLEIGSAVDATSGYIANFPGTIVHASIHCANGNGNTKNIHVFVNGVDAGSIGIVTAGANTSLINNTIDIDFTQGDKIRLQAQQGSGGAIHDTVVKLTLKWRG